MSNENLMARAPVERLVGRIIKVKCKSNRFDYIEISCFVNALLEGNRHALSDNWPFNGEDGENPDVGLSFRLRRILGGFSVTLWDTPPNPSDQRADQGVQHGK